MEMKNIDQLSAREAVNVLCDIRNRYEKGLMSMNEANAVGKPYVDIYNEKAKEIAKKYNQKNRTIRYNVKFWPTNVL